MLLEHLPEDYAASAPVAAMQRAFEKQLLLLFAQRDSFADALCARTAGERGIWYWEAALGLAGTGSLEERRSAVCAKLVGVEVCTVDFIKNFCRAWIGGEVAVTEDAAHARVTVTFISQLGIPDGAKQLKALLRQYVPAHLELVFVYLYNTWGDARALTWQDAKAYTWGEIKEADLND